MKSAFSLLWQAMSVALGMFVLAAVLWWALAAHSRMWRRVFAVYAVRAAGPALARKKIDTIVVAAGDLRGPGSSDYRSYAGTTIALHSDGLSLALMPPFNLGCPPLFLPFDELSLAPTYWAMWPDPVAVRMRRLPDVDIILARDTVRWLEQHSTRGPFDRPPTG